MTNLQAMQDERLRDLIRDVELLDKLIPFADSKQYRDLCGERDELCRSVKERWQELMEEGNG